MNTLKSHPIVVAAAVFGVIVCLSIVLIVRNAKKQNARQEQSSVISDFDISAVLPDTAGIDTLAPQSKPPVLKISGRENPDVYLQSLDIQVEVTGSVASTRYTMVFKNKTGNVLEGELTFPLPDGRTVTYYALDINGKMREAVPVEKARGTEVFEEIEQRGVDPGLLERVEGNNFRTRIYPIPARGTRTIAIGYEEELALEKNLLNYRLPMDYPDSLENFAVKATVWKGNVKPIDPESDDGLRFDKVDENYVASFAKEKYRPARSLNFALPAPADIPRVMMQSAQGNYYFLASVAPTLETRKKRWDSDLAIIWDVSLSGSQRDLKRELDLLNIIFSEKKEADVRIYFLNNRFKKAVNKDSNNGEYKVSDGKWDGLRKVLETAVFDGGTDFSQININDITGNEILFFSDGISTLSDADFLKNVTVNRPIHCFVSSAKADYSAMKLISGKTKGKFVNINALSPAKLKDELLNETLQFLGAEYGKSIREVYPSISTPVHGNFSVAGISSAANTDLTLLFGFGNSVEKRITVKLDAKNASRQGNAHKIWAQKKIAELDLNYEKNRSELTELGQQFGIVTRNTSLIVLETVNDYIRYNITPPKELQAEYQRMTRGRDGDKNNSGGQRTELDDLMEGLTSGVAAVSPRWNMTNRSVRDENDNEPRGKRTALAARDEDDNTPRGSRTMPADPSGVSSNKGGGDPRVRVTQMGVLGVVSGQVKGKAVASADVFGKGGLPTDIDAILSNVGGLKSGGDGSSDRKGTAGIGYGSGYGSGFGGSGGGTDDLLGGLMGGGGGGLELRKKTGELKITSPDFLRGGSLTGGRSRASIQRVVMQNMAALRYAYNKRLREKPGMCGKITVKFAIDEFGKAIFAKVVESSMNDSALEQTVLHRIKSWDFERIDKPGDVTEVTYPLVFSDDFCKASGTALNSAQTNQRTETIDQSLDKIDQQTKRERTAQEVKDSIKQAKEWAAQLAKERAEQLAWEKKVRAEELAWERRERALQKERERIERAEELAWERRRRAAEERERAEQLARERADTLNGAVTAAQKLREWWNTDFSTLIKPQHSKYPTPDEEGGLFEESGPLTDNNFKKSVFVKNTAYLKKMTGEIADDYQTYLSVRKDYANSPTFYFDMANWFYACGDKETAIRVLTSIADLELENASLYRLLGYRLKEFGEYALESFVCRKVVKWRPMEPQSYRDYALALADNGETQAALNWLNGLLAKTYSENIKNRSGGIGEVAVTEINALIAKNPTLNKSKVYKKLLTNIPVDIRVVINWNMNSTDIDLHVVDPTGEECYYSRKETAIGGRMSADNRNGYGPEQFLLKKAVKGRYRVYVNYYGDRQVTNAGPSTVMAEIYTKYAGKAERRQVICLQMSNAKKRDDKYVEIAEFEF